METAVLTTTPPFSGDTAVGRQQPLAKFAKAVALGALAFLYIVELIPRWGAFLAVVGWVLAARASEKKLVSQLEAQWAALAAGDLEAGVQAAGTRVLQPVTGIYIDVLNLRLSLLDRDLDAGDYQLLLALDQGTGARAVRSVTEEQLDSLPVRIHRAAAASGALAAAPAHGAGSCGLQISTQGSQLAGCPGATPQGEGPGGADCAICLEHYADGEKVLVLPCRHDFHTPCIKQWLRQEGTAAYCPMCKAPVFGASEGGPAH